MDCSYIYHFGSTRIRIKWKLTLHVSVINDFNQYIICLPKKEKKSIYHLLESGLGISMFIAVLYGDNCSKVHRILSQVYLLQSITETQRFGVSTIPWPFNKIGALLTPSKLDAVGNHMACMARKPHPISLLGVP